MATIKVMILGSETVWLNLLVTHLESEQDFLVIMPDNNEADVVELITHLEPDLVVMDIDSIEVGKSSMSVAYKAVRHCKAKVIILASMYKEELIKDCFAMGVKDYVIKRDYRELPERIRNVYLNKATPFHVLRKDYQRLRIQNQWCALLSPAEQEVLDLILNLDCSASMIATELVKSENTVKTQIRSIYKKLEVRNRRELLALFKTGVLEDKYLRKES